MTYLAMRYKIQQLLDELVVLSSDEKAEFMRKLAFMNAKQIGKTEEILRRALKSQKSLLEEIAEDKPDFDKKINLLETGNFKKFHAKSKNQQNRKMIQKLITLKSNGRRKS